DLLLLGEAPLFRDQFGDARLVLTGGEAHPRQNEVDLQVPQVLRAELRLTRKQVDLPQIRAALVEQLGVARHGTYPDPPVRREIRPQHLRALLRRELLAGLARELLVEVLRAAAVRFELHQA